MYKPNMTAAVAALLLATAPLAYAQAATASSDTVATSSVIQPDQIRASKMIGSDVYSVQNADVGKVQDIILDQDGRVASVIVDVGSFLGMGGKDVAIRLSDIKSDNNRLTLDMTKEQLQQAQAYQLENPDTGAGSSTSPVHGGHLGSGAGTNTAPRQ
ncbi:MAG TPA: PRC-barrel domain-containing protein [Stellaceae bacterium]|nr:PRC-barrel domain-containing protein [Stellaceae bacterium]